MAKDDAKRVLADEIGEDAKKRAERVLTQAKTDADRLTANAKSEAKAET
jgi:hypothetical protein